MKPEYPDDDLGAAFDKSMRKSSKAKEKRKIKALIDKALEEELGNW